MNLLAVVRDAVQMLLWCHEDISTGSNEKPTRDKKDKETTRVSIVVVVLMITPLMSNMPLWCLRRRLLPADKIPNKHCPKETYRRCPKVDRKGECDGGGSGDQRTEKKKERTRERVRV